MFNNCIKILNKNTDQVFLRLFYINCLGKPRFIYLILLFDATLMKDK